MYSFERYRQIFKWTVGLVFGVNNWKEIQNPMVGYTLGKSMTSEQNQLPVIVGSAVSFVDSGEYYIGYVMDTIPIEESEFVIL